MIRFDNISKGFWIRGDYRPVIRNLNLTLPSGKSLALLGRNGAGKSTLLSIVAGTMRPDTGQIISDGSISFTVGFAGSFHGDMTGAQNTRFVARVYGVDTDELTAFVEDFAEIGEHFNMPVRTYSAGMKSRLAFGISMGIKFDTYLIDEATATGDARFRRKSSEVFRTRMAQSSAIMVSHSMADIRNFCDAGLVLHDGGIEVFDDVEDAIKRHEALMR
ncbi:MAG: ABC transporter ATP-binding protein [Paracoccaceae bacterium]|jgi:capsular polysaccharide transport system ATP-binding protein|uniref:ABC transporter ATP-binding protein n=1 Tax=unclassified Seohaeicola TaxID=2641111 RepID=UPI00237B2EA9|nr:MULTISPECIES: ABC transporter ATP-binding protein [unclassified Seohaeicola]MDD9708194.1 ABC transporter ATP-binding protein [Seohaeicola sp. 4SK31]MDD9736408.1 ABC transporter ATP-binding protein [Seohaeicola sp. SP36]